MGEIYLITGPTGKCYVGATKHTAEVRFKGHYRDAIINGCGGYLYSAMRSHGFENFGVETLIVGSQKYVFDLEDKFINLFGTRSPTGYNAVRGGRHTGDPVAAVRYRMGASNRGKSVHPNASAALKKRHADGKGTPEYQASQSRASQAAWVKPEHRVKMRKVLAKINKDPEVRRQRSERMKAQRRDPEFNRLFREAHRARAKALA